MINGNNLVLLRKLIELGSIEPKGKNNMNEITYTDKPDVPAGEKLVELFDEQGSHTGWTLVPETPSDGEATPEVTTVFTTAEDGEHVV